VQQCRKDNLVPLVLTLSPVCQRWHGRATVIYRQREGGFKVVAPVAGILRNR